MNASGNFIKRVLSRPLFASGKITLWNLFFAVIHTIFVLLTRYYEVSIDPDRLIDVGFIIIYLILGPGFTILGALLSLWTIVAMVIRGIKREITVWRTLVGILVGILLVIFNSVFFLWFFLILVAG